MLGQVESMEWQKQKQKWKQNKNEIKNKNENEHRNELPYTVKKFGRFLLNIDELFNQNFNQKAKVPND